MIDALSKCGADLVYAKYHPSDNMKSSDCTSWGLEQERISMKHHIRDTDSFALV